MANKNKTKNISKKEEKRSLFSSLLFNWVKPVLETGKKRPLVFEDLPPLSYYYYIISENYYASNIKKTFYEYWEKEKSKKKYNLKYIM